ncbi:MAG TPA: hypothetical protein RMH99_03700 [Sandaracinaceae bacterium LLY-WYZ-13_1]|nr:hypothetical protein [Sandaracinaceae bacterium LLY-WYZ-13_1]
MTRRTLVRLSVCVGLFGLDRALTWLAFEAAVAEAFLSPAGASLEALGLAAAFLAGRLTFAVALCVTAALLARDLVRWAFRAAGRRTPARRR